MKVVMVIADARLYEDGAIGQAFRVDIATEVVEVDACKQKKEINSMMVKFLHFIYHFR